MHPLAQSAAVSSLHSPTINLNLGAIGRIDSYRVEGAGCPSLSHRDEFVAIAAAHTGLPRPPRDLDGHAISIPDCPNLLVLAAIAHQVAYYVIANVAERSAFAALTGALKRQRLELVLTSDNSRPRWSALRFEDGAEEQLGLQLRARKDAWRDTTDLWRDKLGWLVTELPARFAQHDAAAMTCTHHAAVLASGNRATFLNAVERCASGAHPKVSACHETADQKPVSKA